LTESVIFGDFISNKVKKGHNVRFEGFNTILGRTTIGNNCLVGLGSVIGYPSRENLSDFLERKNMEAKTGESFNVYELDEISKGSTIGNDCTIRGQAWIYEGAVIGNRVETGHNIMIREGVVIGSNTKIGTNTVIDGSVYAPNEEIKIGHNVNIQTSVYIAAPSVIGSNVFIGPHVTFTNDKYPPSKLMRGIVVEDGAIIGANSTLIAGVIV
jgi:UDP-3-O-[3-hydroxymyristoyl] glucosamine N-acyltransferase